MPALLEIVKEEDVRAFARGHLAKTDQDAVSKVVRNDSVAKAVFEKELELQGKKMTNSNQVELEKKEAKLGDNSKLTAKLLGAAFIMIAAIAIITFAALNLGQ